MPGGDRTGPMGAGPMTGRGAGLCAGFGVPGYTNPGFGRGFCGGRDRGFGHAMGMGGGRGWRNQYSLTGLPGWARTGKAYGYRSQAAESPAGSATARDDELNYLKQEAQNLKAALKNIEARVQQLQRGVECDPKGYRE